jgi:hypothetical protein
MWQAGVAVDDVCHQEILPWTWGKPRTTCQHSKSPRLESNLLSPDYERILFSLIINGKWNFAELMNKSLPARRSGDRIPVEARFSAPVQTGPGAHPASYTMGTGSFPGVKWPGRGGDHQPLSSAEVKERVELYLYSPSGPSWPVIGWPLPLHLMNKFIKIIGIISVKDKINEL